MSKVPDAQQQGGYREQTQDWDGWSPFVDEAWARVRMEGEEAVLD